MAVKELEVREVLALVEQGVVDPCVWCGRSTAFGSGNGLFVNRIGADRQEGENADYIDGWACPECAGYVCDECGENIYIDEEVRVDHIDKDNNTWFYGNYHEKCHDEKKHGVAQEYVED